MKNIGLMAFCALISFYAIGQQKVTDWFVTKDITTTRMLADSIALNAKDMFVFVNMEEQNLPKYNKSFLIYTYTIAGSEDKQMKIYFEKLINGANKDLEITGTVAYQFKSTVSTFLNLYGFWKKFIQPDSSPENVVKRMGARENFQDKTLRLNKDQDRWEMFFR